MAVFGIFGKKQQTLPPPPPKPRSFNMDNIFDVIEYCVLKDPENATAIITQFLTDNPDQLNKRYNDETKPENGASLWRVEGATPLMVLMHFNNSRNAKIYDHIEDGQRIEGKMAIFEPQLFDNLIALGADLNAEDKQSRTALFYTTENNKDITIKLLENGLEYHKFFNGEERCISGSYTSYVHYAIQEFESGKFTRLDNHTAALSHIFYTKASQYYPSGDYNFKDLNNGQYVLRKRLLVDFAQNAVHHQEGYDGNMGYSTGQWRTKDIESFDTYLNQDLINRARAFMESGAQIESTKAVSAPSTKSATNKRSFQPIV